MAYVKAHFSHISEITLQGILSLNPALFYCFTVAFLLVDQTDPGAVDTMTIRELYGCK